MSFPFQLFHRAIHVIHHGREFEKYKSILDREWEEFKQQLQREVSTFLSFQVGKRSSIGTKHNWNFVTNFASVIIYFFFLKFVVYSLQCSSSLLL